MNFTLQADSEEYLFEQLFKKYYKRLCHFSYQIVKEQQAAEDIAQEAFVKYWNSRKAISSNEDAVIKSFLYNTARNASLNVIRHNKVAQGYLDSQDTLQIEERTIINLIIKSEVIAEIYEAIGSLPESCQRISRMGFLEGMKNKEIANKLGITVNTVKTQKQRALQLLRLRIMPDIIVLIFFFYLI